MTIPPCYKLLLTVVMFVSSNTLNATQYLLPSNPQDSLITEFDVKTIKEVRARDDEDLLDIARRFDLGQNEIVYLNPKVDRWSPKKDTIVTLPSIRLLPDTQRKGIVLNLAEFRLYYYPKAARNAPAMVITHPISIGRQDWNTPLGKTKITAKKENPTWTPPASIKKEHLEKGDPLPDVVPAGPDNPLGLYAMRLGIPGYLIHSTNKAYGVGSRVSHGCIRMYPEDIATLFPKIKVGNLVTIVNQEIKVGWLGNQLFIEVHRALEETENNNEESLLDQALDLIEKANKGVLPLIKGKILRAALTEKTGLAVKIFEKPAIKSEPKTVIIK